MLDYIRIACAVPEVKVADVPKNVGDICAFMEQADVENADILLFPELTVTGSTCGDLFYQDALLKNAEEGLAKIVACSEKYPKLHVVLGLPVRVGMKLANCAALINDGQIRGLVSKSNLAGDGRWFAAVEEGTVAELLGEHQIVSTELMYQVGDAVVGIEIGQDLLSPIAASTLLALNGAEVILNPAAASEQVGGKLARRSRIQAQSEICKCVYAYVSAGCTESTADLVYSGHSCVAENGAVLAESEGTVAAGYMMVQDCDLGIIRAARRHDAAFLAAADRFGGTMRRERYIGGELRSDGSKYPLRKLPFIPDTKLERDAYCMDVFQIQVAGLKQRLKTIRFNAVIGISGGLDSTLALLVCVEAMRQLGRPMTDIYGVTMPCFGTSDRTYQNSWELMRTLGIHAKEISIKDAVTLHFQDIGHDMGVHNGTFENSQARERTQILMDYASTVNGIVIGTGDLSELALGWCTYNGDHMSMYAVNGSVPKTLIRWMIEAIAAAPEFEASRAVLADILDTPISPELLPPDAEGKIAQQTEDLVGPYALHDFFLYHMLKYGFSPTKIYPLACRAFRDDFAPDVIKKWLRTFYWRFFTQQFKRNCMADGVKALPLSFSPRGDWAMPSDAAATVWLNEMDTI